VEVINVDLGTGENFGEEEHLRISPMGKVPILIDDNGFALTDACTIMTYLVNAKARGSSLYPINPQKRAFIESRLYNDAIAFENLVAAAYVRA
jgi:glutathione S-transferase